MWCACLGKRRMQVTERRHAKFFAHMYTIRDTSAVIYQYRHKSNSREKQNGLAIFSLEAVSYTHLTLPTIYSV